MSQVTKDEKYAMVVRDIIEYVNRDLSHPVRYLKSKLKLASKYCIEYIWKFIRVNILCRTFDDDLFCFLTSIPLLY